MYKQHEIDPMNNYLDVVLQLEAVLFVATEVDVAVAVADVDETFDDLWNQTNN